MRECPQDYQAITVKQLVTIYIIKKRLISPAVSSDGSVLVGLYFFVVNSEQLYIRGGTNEKKYRSFLIKRRSRISVSLDQ